IGPGATSLAFRLSLDGTVPMDFKIVLNTFESIWRVEYFVNGDSRGVYPLATSAVESIRGIGFSRTSGAAGATGGIVSNFRLSASTTPTIPATPPRPPAETGIVYQHDFSGS